jgi:hypothetical protein
VALASGAAGEEHGRSRGGRRVKCDEEKAKVNFALMMEAAQGRLTVLKPQVEGGRRPVGDRGRDHGLLRALAKRPRAGFIASVGCTVRVGRAHNKFY